MMPPPKDPSAKKKRVELEDEDLEGEEEVKD